MVTAGTPLTEVADVLGVSRTTLYRHLKTTRPRAPPRRRWGVRGGRARRADTNPSPGRRPPSCADLAVLWLHPDPDTPGAVIEGRALPHLPPSGAGGGRGVHRPAAGPPPSSPAIRDRFRAQKVRDTAPELAPRRLLHARGLRYRVDTAPLPGVRRRADVVFTRARVAVFVDGCFWHSCPLHATSPKANAVWWRTKLDTTVRRDRDTDTALSEAGWLVVRVWEHEPPPRGPPTGWPPPTPPEPPGRPRRVDQALSSPGRRGAAPPGPVAAACPCWWSPRPPRTAPARRHPRCPSGRARHPSRAGPPGSRTGSPRRR